MSYHLQQVRNLEKEAKIERQLVGVKLVQSRMTQQKHNRDLFNKKTLAKSRRQQDTERTIQLQKSRLESEFEASSVSTDAILNRSRIQAALDVRDSSQRFYRQKQLFLLHQRQVMERQYFEQRQLQLKRQNQLKELQQLEFLRQIRKKRQDDILREELYNKKIQNKLNYESQIARNQQLEYQDIVLRRVYQRQYYGYPYY